MSHAGGEPVWAEPVWAEPAQQAAVAADQPAPAPDVPELLQPPRLSRWRTGLRTHGAHPAAAGVSPGQSVHGDVRTARPRSCRLALPVQSQTRNPT